jgi:hypothetical protein
MANTTLGQIAFEAYNEAVGGKTWDGKPIPAWAEINEKVRNGWEQSALAVVREKQKEVASKIGLVMGFSDAHTRKS